MTIRDVLSPFTVWKNVFRDPVTVRDPLNDRPGSARYRGFHKNDVEKCIGCGTCETICQNGAIDMVPVEGLATEQGDSGLRPRIDYGRCCWCALCVDVCMTGSLSMSNEYKWVDSDPDAFRFTPGVDAKPWDGAELGYHRPDGHRLTIERRVHMGELEPAERLAGFGELMSGYSVEEARAEADRCVACGLCVATCPVHMAIPDYIAAIRDGDYQRGLELLYDTNPLSSVCGRICTHKCESACAARHEGDPIAIRWLKRHIIDQVDHNQRLATIGEPATATGRKVAVIGAGPAGLTAAFDLARRGHKVTVYEAQDQPGGMMRYGIPEYRLPYASLDADIGVMHALGVDIRCKARIGKDLTFDELRNGSDAVLVATGLWNPRSTRVPGTDHPRVLSAIGVLEAVTRGGRMEVPERVVVVGGGNVAFDAARSLARRQKARYGRVAVDVIALEDRKHMLADEEEVEEAAAEGVQLFNSWGPRRVVIEGGKVTGLETVRCLSLLDAEGRFHPKYDDTSVVLHHADTIVEAIGQAADTSYLGKELTEELDWNRGRLKIDRAGRTSLDWLWAAGDMVEGPDVVHAIAAGHRAAASMHVYLVAIGARAPG